MISVGPASLQKCVGGFLLYKLEDLAGICEEKQYDEKSRSKFRWPNNKNAGTSILPPPPPNFIFMGAEIFLEKSDPNNKGKSKHDN